MKTITTLIILSLSAFMAVAILLGCDQQGLLSRPKADAVATLVPTQGNAAAGVITFSKSKEGVRVIARIVDLSPGAHGIHIHEFGDCRADDGSSAGDHFNPHGKAHGAPEATQRHVGDLGNIMADQNGVAIIDIVDPLITLDGENAIIGRSVVVHGNEDDFTTQPHGAAGERLACGTIGFARQ